MSCYITLEELFNKMHDVTVTLYPNQPERETIMSIEGPVVCAEWVNLGEGVCGDYDPENPDDVNLLRFDIYIRDEDPVAELPWRAVEDASYCTNVEADTPTSELLQKLWIIYKNYNDVLSADREASVKKLGEQLSWI